VASYCDVLRSEIKLHFRFKVECLVEVKMVCMQFMCVYIYAAYIF